MKEGHSNTQKLCPKRDAAVSKRDQRQGCEVRTEIGNTAAECEIAENDKMYGPFDTVSDLMKALNTP